MNLTDRSKQRYNAASERATTWVNERKDQDGIVGLATTLYARDRDAFASVLGSAIALRMFLFVVPANVTLLGLVNVIRLGGPLGRLLESSPTTGAMAEHYGGLSAWHALLIAMSGAVLTLWAGRSLTRVLATCSAAAWQLPARSAKVGARGIGAMTAMVLTLMLATVTFSAIRERGGVAISFAVWLTVAATFMVGWFIVQLVLPRGSIDPGSVLPGAALVGVGFAVLQWFMQIYLPGKIERTTDTLGSLASTVATLGYFFFIGRLMSASFVTNAVVFQRWGSITRVVFGLPGLRWIVARSPRLQTFFDVGPTTDPPNADGDGGLGDGGLPHSEPL